MSDEDKGSGAGVPDDRDEVHTTADDALNAGNSPDSPDFPAKDANPSGGLSDLTVEDPIEPPTEQEREGEGGSTRPDLPEPDVPADAGSTGTDPADQQDDPAAEDTVANGEEPAIPAASAARGRRSRPKKQTSRRRRYVRRGLYAVAGVLLLPVVGFLIIYLLTPIPSSAQAAAKAQKSTFYYSDGSVIARSGDFDRRPVDIKDVPKHVQAAVISAENRSFYTDPGVSVKGSARAVWATLTGGSTQGGSTITQQMVRNYYSGLSQERTVSRKLKEIMIALKVGREKDKSWILQQYLNTIYFGRDAYGIQAASLAYFDKDVKDLTPSEGAYLAAAIQVPTYFSEPNKSTMPYIKARWRYVISGMVQSHAITAQQASTMKFPDVPPQKQKSVYGGFKGYIVSEAKAELRQMGYTDNQINMGGLKVRTSIDKDLMTAAKNAVEDNVPDGTPKSVSTGLVSVNPANGEVRAFYGGKDYVKQQFDNAFDAKVQAGSGFKPYALAAALDDGMSLDSTVDGSSPQTFHGSKVKNDEGRSYGTINLVTATEQSVNTAYVNLGQKVGLDKIVQMAEKCGIPSAQLTANGANTAPTLPLGVVSVSPVQQAAGFATFASEGVYHRPHLVRQVEERDGDTRKVTVPDQRAFSKTVARDATYAMQKVVDNGTGTNASLPDRNAAGKTGTTDSGKSIWFNGFIPQLSTSVAMFNRQTNKALKIPGYSAYGGQLPAQIWRSFMVEADKNLEVKNFGPPSISVGDQGGLPTEPTSPHPRPTEPEPSSSVGQPTEEPPEKPPGQGTSPTEEPPNTRFPTPPRVKQGSES